MPIPTLSVIVVSLTTVPSSVQPELAAVAAAMVIFLLLVSVVRVTFEPAANSSVSSLPPAEIVSDPTVIFLKTSKEEAGSSFVIVSPSMLIPSPAVSEILPVSP